MRTVYVPAARLDRWIAGFGERHPGLTALIGPDGAELRALDGSTAVLAPAFGPLLVEAPRSGPQVVGPTPTNAGPIHAAPPAVGAGSADPASELAGTPPGETPLGASAAGLSVRSTPAEVAAALLADAYGCRVLRALMIRRGGYACAVLTDDRVTAAKVGSRHVQGRTAAGGWSQQRFARRREGQVDTLVGSATEVAVRLLLPADPDDALITGGDRPLIDRVLADPRLKPLSGLRRGPHLEIGDPRSDLVQDLPERGRAVRISLDER